MGTPPPPPHQGPHSVAGGTWDVVKTKATGVTSSLLLT